MREITGDIWEVPSDAICIPTNGIVKARGGLVMGAGLAKQAADRYPKLPSILGASVSGFGNIPFWVPEYKIFSFPTKHHWKDSSDIALIERSARAIVKTLGQSPVFNVIVLPRVGCGLGGLRWEDVKKVLDPILYDRFYVVNPI